MAVSIIKKKQWSGYWTHDSDCVYREFSESELQKCIDRQKIYEMASIGKSIAGLISGYIKERFANIRFYNNTLGDGKIVKYATYANVHYTHKEEELISFMKQLPNITLHQLQKRRCFLSMEILSVVSANFLHLHLKWKSSVNFVSKFWSQRAIKS